jgi:glycosyltransferase involved in cell wall biosynthesis
MASGLPVVTHTGGDGAQAELVTDQYNGFVVDPRHIRSYAARVIQLLNDPGLKKQMGDRGKSRVKEWFSVSRIVRQVEEVFTDLYSRYST